MFNDALVPEMTDVDCHICMVPHDEEIHAATLSLRQWFRFEVTKYFYDESDELYLIEDDSQAFELVA